MQDPNHAQVCCSLPPFSQIWLTLHSRNCDHERYSAFWHSGRNSWYSEFVRVQNATIWTFLIPLYSQWKHWGCVTPKVLEKIRGQFSDATELDGFDELTETDKSKIVKAYEEGHVADEDIPDSARKLEGEEQPKQKAAGKKKASKKDEDAAEGDGEQAEEKPKKKVSKKKDEDNLDGEDEVVKEKPKKARNTKKACDILLIYIDQVW